MRQRALFIAASIVSACILSLLTLLTIEYTADTAPLGASEMFVIENDTPGSNLLEDIAEYASNTDVPLALAALDKEEGGWKRHLYIFSREANKGEIDKLATAFDFGRYTRSAVHTSSESADISPIGTWFAFDSTNVEEFYSFLESKSVSYHVVLSIKNPQLSGLPYSILSLLVALIFLNAGIAVVDVISRQRYHALARLHGHQPASAWAYDVSPVIFAWVASLIVALACGWIAFTAIHRFDAFPFFVGQMAVFWAATVIPLIATHALVSIVMRRENVLASVLGEVHGRFLLGIIYIIRICVIVLALNLGLSFATNQLIASEQEKARAHIEELGEFFTPAAGGAYSQDTMAEAGPFFHTWLHEQDQSGNLLYSYVQWGSEDISPILYMNTRMFETHNVYDASGAMITLAPDTILLAHSANHCDMPFSMAERETLLSEIEPSFAHNARIDESCLAGDTKLFNASALAGLGERAFMDDATLVVIPNGHTDEYWNAQNGSLIVQQHGLVEKISTDPVAKTYIAYLADANKNAATNLAVTMRDVHVIESAWIISLLVLVCSAIAATHSYTYRNSRRLFLKHVYGWHPIRAYLPLLLLEIVTMGAVAGWVYRTAAPKSQEYFIAAVSTSTVFMVAAAAACTSLASFLISLLFYIRRTYRLEMNAE